MNYKLIDTHAHLDFKDFQDNIEEILENSKAVGVEKIIIPGVTLEDMHKIINLIEKYDNLYGAAAIHPSEAKSWQEEYYELFKEYAQHDKVVAIGETGLDYYHDATFKETQQHVFRRHLELAEELNIPVIVHDRESHDDVLAILKEFPEVKGVMHCFSGDADFAMKCIELGYFIALGGPVTFKNAISPKEVAQIIPIEKLVLETDSPFLAPHPFRGKENDPSKIILVAETIAEIKGLSVEEVANITSSNAERLFGI
ncbi:MAG: TatD family hydrolase [bacterium]